MELGISVSHLGVVEAIGRKKFLHEILVCADILVKRNPFIRGTVRKRVRFGSAKPKNHTAEIRLVLMYLPNPAAEAMNLKPGIVDARRLQGFRCRVRVRQLCIPLSGTGSSYRVDRVWAQDLTAPARRAISPRWPKRMCPLPR